MKLTQFMKFRLSTEAEWKKALVIKRACILKRIKEFKTASKMKRYDTFTVYLNDLRALV